MGDALMALKISPRDPVVLYSAYHNDLIMLQGEVQGDIEALGLGDGAVMLMNEMPQPGTPLNPLASAIASARTDRIHMVRGSVLIVGQEGEEFCDVPANVWDTLYTIMEGGITL